jgi:surfeit locus 1 family protein
VDEGEVIVEGMLTKRFSVGKGSEWQPDNVPEKGEWFWRDVEAMANFAGGDAKGVQPVLVDVIGCE